MTLAASRPSEAARSPHVGRSVPAPFKWPESSGRFLRRLHSAHSLPSTGLRRPGRGDDTMETMKQMPTEPMKPVAADGRKAIEQALKRVPCAVLEQSLEKRHETRTY